MTLHRGSAEPLPSHACPLPSKDTYVYICQSSAIGSDVIMNVTTRGLVTISRYTPHDLAVQAIGRARSLKDGQTLGFVCPEEDVKVVKQALKKDSQDPLTLTDVLQHPVIVMGKLKDKENFFALSRYLGNLCEEELWKHLKGYCSEEKLTELFHFMEPLMTTSTEEEEADQEEEIELEIKEAVKRIRTTCQTKLNVIQTAHPELNIDVEALLKKFDQEVDYNKLPATIVMSDNIDQECIVDVDADAIGELQHEQDEEMFEEQIGEQEQEQDTHGEIPIIDYTPAPPRVWSGNYVTQRAVSPVTEILGIQLLDFPNHGFVSDNNEVNKKVRKPSYQYLIVRPQGSQPWQYIPLDMEDASLVFKHMLQHGGNIRLPSDSNVDFFLMEDGRLLAFDGSISDLDAEEDTFYLDRIKILNKIGRGASRFSKAEIALIHQTQETKKIRNLVESYSASWPQMQNLLEQLKI